MKASQYKDMSHAESLTECVYAWCGYSGEPINSADYTDLILEYERGENVAFSDGEILAALRDGIERWVDAYQQNEAETIAYALKRMNTLPCDHPDYDGLKERVAVCESRARELENCRPSVIRRKHCLAILAA